MKILFYIACLLVHTWSYSQTPENPYIPGLFPDRIILNMTENPATSVALNWRTADSITISHVELTLASTDPRDFQKVSKLTPTTESFSWEGTPRSNYHSILLKDLQPKTTYAYRVGNGNFWSEWFHFTTANDQPSPFTFVYYGDVQIGMKSLWSRMVKESFRNVPDAQLTIYGGDLINKANRDVEWGEWFAAGNMSHTMIPSIMTPGNHDHYDNEAGKNTISAFWQPQFNLPLNGPSGLKESAYYLDVQGIRFISINSDQVEESDEFLESQKVWLEEVLKNNPNKWTVLTFHHPIFSPKTTRDNPRMRTNFKPLIDRYKVDLVLQGHDHTYARGMEKIPMEKKTDKSGTMYVVSVAGPKMTGTSVEKSAWMDRKAIYTQLYHKVVIDGNVLKFQSFTATNELYDAFELHKQKGKINKVVNQIPTNVAER